MSGAGTGAPGPASLASRALAPDLARGVMLLFIALANSHYFLRGPSVLGGYPQDGSGADRAVAWALSTFVDGRAFPLFGLLFGYGVARIADRHQALGPRSVRRLLWRRSLVLVAVGFVHAVLLYVGDILTAYGVLLFLGVWALRWSDRRLLALAAVMLLIVAVPGEGSLTASTDPPGPAMLPPDALTMVVERVPVSLFIAVLGPISFLGPLLVGLWSGRRRILEGPERHRRLLLGTAVVGLLVAVLGAQPIALVHAGVLDRPDGAGLQVLGALHDATGVLGGFGYAALLALVAVRLEAGRRGPVVEAITAAGQRSMTCYLSQSVVWAVVFTPFLLDLSDTLDVATTALLASATWVATVVVADRMRRAGHRGPFESLVRRVTYGRRGRA